jgi:SAM-dependent methyltransferase
MNNSVSEFYNSSVGQDIKEYDQSHDPRFEFLIKDLNLDAIKNSRIGDFGCGYAPIFKRIPENNNQLYGFDGADIKNLMKNVCEYHVTDLNLEFADRFLENHEKLDYAFCFETLEHLPNPYNCLSEIKKLLKIGGVLYLSIPDIECRHGTLYPTLLYPREHFMVFLEQMAFKVLDMRLHNKAFVQNVFILENLEWKFSKNFFHYGKTNIEYYGENFEKINSPIIDLVNS